tara:strand:- start:1821 stop:2906 length:1086 start_codon:yes stop_codon:yes gene_type:complete
MAKLLTSFYDYIGSGGKTYGREIEGQSIFFNLIGATGSSGAVYPGYCYCQGGCEYNPTGFDSDIPRYKWEVPDGITSATFQLWGGGGWGAGSYHCQQGVSGGSGAFAQKTISVSAGDVYQLCLGCIIRPVGTDQTDTTAGTYHCQVPTCTSCAVESLNFGKRGPKAYVVGNGLTNFCAEGGNPGVQVGCGWISRNAGSYPSALKFRCYENLYMCDILGRSTEDSDNDFYHRACFYGADDGGRGLQGYVQASCCNSCNGGSDFCGVQHMIPFTGYQPDFSHGWTGTASGGWVVQRQCGTGMGSTTWVSHKAINSYTPYIGSGGTTMEFPMKWGAGGFSPITTGGNVCCGNAGGPNAIRVIFS